MDLSALTLASSCARPLELACQSSLAPILWPSHTVSLGESPASWWGRTDASPASLQAASVQSESSSFGNLQTSGG